MSGYPDTCLEELLLTETSSMRRAVRKGWCETLSVLGRTQCYQKKNSTTKLSQYFSVHFGLSKLLVMKVIHFHKVQHLETFWCTKLKQILPVLTDIHCYFKPEKWSSVLLQNPNMLWRLEFFCFESNAKIPFLFLSWVFNSHTCHSAEVGVIFLVQNGTEVQFPPHQGRVADATPCIRCFLKSIFYSEISYLPSLGLPVVLNSQLSWGFWVINIWISG